jgi:thimet oligopeptidase
MLPGGQTGDPGLLSPNDVRNVFHEFGHLVHGILAGQHHWIGMAGIHPEFAEAPSQLLEEWSSDPRTLATFARHFQTNEPIPVALVDRMRRQENIGKALNVRTQMINAKFALSLHDRDPHALDFTAMLKELNARYLPGRPFVEGTHRETSFEHLANPGYASAYYTYMWLLVVVKDLFTQFDRENLLAADVGHRYRDAVLVPGGSKPEAKLIEDFLGRPFSLNAWEEWLNGETQ